jgi:hypothetical protein
MVRPKNISRAEKAIAEMPNGVWIDINSIARNARLAVQTLSKYLRKLKGLVEKKVDIESGKYPYPVFYRVPESFSIILRQVKLVSILSDKMKKAMLETENPMLVLEYLNTAMNILVLSVLKVMKEVEKETGHINEEHLSLLFSLRIMPFMDLYWTFLTASKGIWDNVDFDQVRKEQLEKLERLRKQAEK